MLVQELKGLPVAHKIALGLMLVVIIFIIGVVIYKGPDADNLGSKQLDNKMVTVPSTLEFNKRTNQQVNNKPQPSVPINQTVPSLANLGEVTNVKYNNGNTSYDSYWRVDETGLINQWRIFRDSQNNVVNEHSTFKEEIVNDDPISNLLNINPPSHECSYKGERLKNSLSYNYSASNYIELGNDQGNISDFLKSGTRYWVCQYVWQ